MDGTNAVGRKVSLLNDNDNEAPQLTRLPSFTPSLGSRTSSYATSSIGSPPTPQLIRSNSSDSMDLQTPSPITPDFSSADHEHFANPGFFATQHHQQSKSMDDPYPQMMAYHQPQVAHSVYYAHPAPTQQQHVVAPPAPASANGRPKKNQYPCPLAKQENCPDFFTTSGHAARHSKKHTGRKDAICPECNKAFTRKDNMEQHRRTHKGGRIGAKATSERGAKKAKAREQRPKISPVQSTTSLQSPAMLDPALPVSPTGSFMNQPAPAYMQPPAPVSFMEFEQRNYPDPTAYAMTSTYTYSGPSTSSNDHVGLDVLATAASDPRRFTP